MICVTRLGMELCQAKINYFFYLNLNNVDFEFQKATAKTPVLLIHVKHVP